MQMLIFGILCVITAHALMSANLIFPLQLRFGKVWGWGIMEIVLLIFGTFCVITAHALMSANQIYPLQLGFPKVWGSGIMQYFFNDLHCIQL